MQAQSIRYLFLLIVPLALASLACNLLGGGEETDDPNLLTATSLAATVTAIAPFIDASPTPEVPGVSQDTPTAAPEQPAAPDVPTLEPPPTAQPGEATMTTLVDLNVRRGPGTNYGVENKPGICLAYPPSFCLPVKLSFCLPLPLA